MSEPKRSPFSPTLKQVRDIFYTLNGDSNEFPREWTDISFLPFLTDIGGKRTNFFDLVCLIMKKRWELIEKRSEGYYNLLLLESSLPCKQQTFEEALLYNLNALRRFKEDFNEGGIPEKSELPIDEDGNYEELRYREDKKNPIVPINLAENGIDFYGLMNANQIAATFIDLKEDWDRGNIIFERGVGIAFRPGTERGFTDCTILMSLVKEELDRDANSQKKGPLTPGHILRLRVWNKQKDVLDKFKKDLESFKKRTKRLPQKGPRAINQVDESSAFKGSQQGLGRKRKTKKRRTVRKKFKNKKTLKRK